jgi:hypothetical protein
MLGRQVRRGFLATPSNSGVENLQLSCYSPDLNAAREQLMTACTENASLI